MQTTHIKSQLEKAEPGSPELSRVVEDLGDRFLLDCLKDPGLRIESLWGSDVCQELPEPRRLQLLLHLIRIEIDSRKAQGGVVRPEEYLQRFPDHADWLSSHLPEIVSSLSAYDSTAHAGIKAGNSGDSGFVYRPDPTAPPEQEALRVGRYELLEPIATGGFGEVWKARHLLLNRIVALKLMRFRQAADDDAHARFLREGERLVQLEHPGIVRVLDADYHQGRPFLVSVYMPSGTLESRLNRGEVPVKTAVKWTIELALSLHQAHVRGYVHRDIKPSNILFDGDDNPLLADFGMAATEAELIVEPPSRSGTTHYMAPEQARGTSHLADSRTDVYSLGMVLYRMLTGRLPFQASTPADYLQQVLTREPRPLRAIKDEIPVELERICLSCLHKEMSARPGTALEFAESLRQWLRKTEPRRRPLPYVAAGVVAVGLAIPALALTLPRDQPLFGNRTLEAPSWQHPELICFNPYDHHDSYGYNPRSGSFEFDAFGEALFQAGEQTEDEIALTLAYDIHPGLGAGGVFWGLGIDSTGQLRCWGILVGKVSASAPYEAIFSEWGIRPFPGGRLIVNGGRTLKRIPVTSSNVRSTLKVEATSRSVKQITHNGVPLLTEEFSLTSADWSLGPGSGFGFCGKSGKVFVYDFNVD